MFLLNEGISRVKMCHPHNLGNYAFLDHTNNDSSSCDCENQTLNGDWKGLIVSRSLCTLSFSPGYCRFPPVKTHSSQVPPAVQAGTYKDTHTHNTEIRVLPSLSIF